MRQKSFRKEVLILIAVFFIIRLISAFCMELGNDETYYWVYSKQLQWNYFDHPPMIAFWIRLFTLNGLFDSEGFIRLGSCVSCAFSTWFIYKAVSLIKDERSGWFAACLLNASLYAGLVAGIMVMPDSPQLFFWTFCLWMIAKLLSGEETKTTWILFGLSAGLCSMSKIHGLFIWIGMALFVLFKKREWLKEPLLYVSLLISAVIISPVFFWNMKYDFITWRFHSERINFIDAGNNKSSFLLSLPEQLLINNPFNIFLIITGLLTFRRKMHTTLVCYNFIAVPLIIILTFISFFREVWYHWSGPAYTTLIPLAAVQLSQLKTKNIFPPVLKWSLSFFGIAVIAWFSIIYLFPGTYGSKQPDTLGNGDITLDKFGWKDAGKRFAELYEAEICNEKDPAEAPIICSSWWGAHAEYYFARPAGITMIGIGNMQNLHQYSWLNEERIIHADMDTAYHILFTAESNPADSLYQDYYRNKERFLSMPVYRNGKIAARFDIYRLYGLKTNQFTSDTLSLASNFTKMNN